MIQGAALEGKQRGVLEAEEGQAGHQGVGQGEGGATPLLGQLVETAAGELDQGVKVEVSALPTGGNTAIHFEVKVIATVA